LASPPLRNFLIRGLDFFAKLKEGEIKKVAKAEQINVGKGKLYWIIFSLFEKIYSLFMY